MSSRESYYIDKIDELSLAISHARAILAALVTEDQFRNVSDDVLVGAIGAAEHILYEAEKGI